MSLDNFQLLDDKATDTSIFKRDYMKVDHHQGAKLIKSIQGIDFFFGEVNNYHQTGNGYLEFDITLRKIGGIIDHIDSDGSVRSRTVSRSRGGGGVEGPMN